MAHMVVWRSVLCEASRCILRAWRCWPAIPPPAQAGVTLPYWFLLGYRCNIGMMEKQTEQNMEITIL